MSGSVIPASLVLAGGLSLGAYQAGVYSALAASGRFRFDAIAGASIGAMNGAIIAGNPPEHSADRLRAFWTTIATEVSPLLPLDPLGWSDRGTVRHRRNWANTISARLAGARGLFSPRMLRPAETPSLYDTAPALTTLPRFVDFERLNSGATRLCVAATDIETAEPVLFDTAAGDGITIDHLLASGALIPAFPAVRIGERLLGDGGFSINAPLEPLLSSERREPAPQLCFLVDLFAPDAPAPRTLEAAVERSTDLKFAAQTGVRLDALRRERTLEAKLTPGGGAGADILYLRYQPSPDESGPEKTYDFSRHTLRDRFAAGERDAAAALALIDHLPLGEPGFRVHRITPPQPQSTGTIGARDVERAA